MRNLILLNAASLFFILLPQYVYAHGAVSYPISRQYQCYQDGNFWGDAKSIPNAGCRASFQTSGFFPFVQWNEVSANPNPRTSQAALEKAVPDGLMCASGDKNKKGLDEPQSKGWKITQLKAGTKIKHVWNLTAPHNPSTHRIYITKAGANFQNRELRWSDLDLDNPLYNGAMAPTIASADGTRTYTTDITLPSDRVGKAIIYSVWQREDVANEAFINCSDIEIVSSTESAPSLNKPTTSISNPAPPPSISNPAATSNKPLIPPVKPVPVQSTPILNKPLPTPTQAVPVNHAPLPIALKPATVDSPLAPPSWMQEAWMQKLWWQTYGKQLQDATNNRASTPTPFKLPADRKTHQSSDHSGH